MLTVQNISVQFGNTPILSDINLDLDCGKMVALCGPNGAGKSTLLKIISGEIKGTSGTVSWNNTQISDWKPNELAKNRGKLSQETRLSFPFRTQEVVDIGRLPYGNAPQNGYVVSQCMKLAHIEHLVDRRYDTLSGGEKQRIHFARVLAQLSAHDPENSTGKLLLLDEPTSALDLKYQEKLLHFAKQLAAHQNYLVIIVLHDLNLAAAWADQMVMMKKGKITYNGTIEEVCTAEILYETYGVKTLILKHPHTHKPIITVDR